VYPPVGKVAELESKVKLIVPLPPGFRDVAPESVAEKGAAV
jgi:hypothetical protein